MSVESEVQDLVAQATAHYRAGNIAEAIHFLSRAILAYPSLFEDTAAQFVAAVPSSDRSQFWSSPKNFYPDGADRKSIFEFIYDRAVWGGGSGAGSNLQFVAPYAAYLQAFIELHAIGSIVDLGCGDWQFSKLLDFSGRNYLGYDLVPSVISANAVAYGGANVRFEQADIVEMNEFPPCDLIVCKDVLQHLSNVCVEGILKKCRRGRFVLVTNDFHPENSDAADGETRPLNVTAAPFNFRARPVLNFGRKVTFLAEMP